MSLIKSISGIRGTIGGRAGEGLNPLDIVKFTSAYATLIRRSSTVKSNKIVVGRDARISGEMVKNVVCGTLMGMGFDVVNIGLATTPTTEIAVTGEGAEGGIITPPATIPVTGTRSSCSTATESSSTLRKATRCCALPKPRISTMPTSIIWVLTKKTIPTTRSISTWCLGSSWLMWMPSEKPISR